MNANGMVDTRNAKAIWWSGRDVEKMTERWSRWNSEKFRGMLKSNPKVGRSCDSHGMLTFRKSFQARSNNVYRMESKRQQDLKAKARARIHHRQGDSIVFVNKVRHNCNRGERHLRDGAFRWPNPAKIVNQTLEATSVAWKYITHSWSRRMTTSSGARPQGPG